MASMVLGLTVCFVRDASGLTAAQWVGLGRAALAFNDIVTANSDFSNAVAVSSSNPDANFFYAITRVAVLPFQPAVKGLLDGFGVSDTGRDLWNWKADFQRDLFNQIVLPTNSPSEAVVMGVLTNSVLPQITGALANLAYIPRNYTNLIGAELNRTNTFQVNYNVEVVLYRSALEAARASILTLNSYNLDANSSALISNMEAGTFDLNNFLAASPQFLTPAPAAASLLPAAATSLDNAIDDFIDGSMAVYGETGRPVCEPGLIDHMLEVQDALYGPLPITSRTTQESTLLDLTPFFDYGPVNLRILLPQFRMDPISHEPRMVAESFPDPTLNGILPEMTQEWLSTNLHAPLILLSVDLNWETGLFGSGLDQEVQTMALVGTNLYVGGWFRTAGGSNANYVATWNGSSWSTLGDGPGGPVYALVVSSNKVYTGGWLWSKTDYSSSNNVAMWDGNSWSTLGTGPNGTVYALALSGGNLYAGGYFTSIGSVAATNIAMWNGSNWSPVGDGVGGSVYALAANSSGVYAAGNFTNAGNVAANNIALWNGSSWTALDNGVTGQYWAVVNSLAVSGTNLYVGGYFSNAGNVAANSIALWNGSNWSTLGAGMGEEYVSVSALAVSGTNLYVGGTFTKAGAVAANNIALWDGMNWSALGSGIDDGDGWVSAIAPYGTNTYVGGWFGSAGGWKAHNIAVWHTPMSSMPTADFIANPAGGLAPLLVNFTDLSSGSITNRFWYFGDGTSTNVTSPGVSHTYAVGTYNITLIVTGPGGVSASTQPNAVAAMTAFQNWQKQYFGCTDCPEAQANADSLAKGMSNTNQYLAGFNPTNAAAYFHILSLAKINGNVDMQVTYLGANGDSTYAGGPAARTNVLEYTTGTANGNYTNNFAPAGRTNILSGGTGLGVVTNMVDSGGATNKPARFYRVRVLVP